MKWFLVLVMITSMSGCGDRVPLPDTRTQAQKDIDKAADIERQKLREKEKIEKEGQVPRGSMPFPSQNPQP